MEGSWTPNQAQKRQVLIDAAASVMRRGGVGACTVRAIADASPLSSGILHYYFRDVDELVDLAFRQIFGGIVDELEKGVSTAADPLATLWAVLATYLAEPDAPDQVRTPILWFEYVTASIRRGDTSAVREITDRLLDVFRQLLAAAGIDDANAKGDTIYAAALGAAARAAISPAEVDAMLTDFSTALDIPRPGH